MTTNYSHIKVKLVEQGHSARRSSLARKWTIYLEEDIKLQRAMKLVFIDDLKSDTSLHGAMCDAWMKS